MLRVLTLSTLFPNASQPTFGNFVERQTLGLATQPGVEVRVVAPLGLPPWPLSLHKNYRKWTGLPALEDWKGLPTYRPPFPILPRFGERWTAWSLATALLPLLRGIRADFAFDVIDCHFFWPEAPAAMLVGRELGVPFLVTARGSDIQYWMRRPAVAPQLLAATGEAGRLLAVSGALRGAMIGFGMPAEKIHVHYTGVDQERFQPVDRSAAKARLGINAPLIVTAGSLIPGKGQGVAIEAAERLPDASLFLVGEGPDRKRLQQMIDRKGLGARVKLLGNRPHDEVAALMAAADLMVLPSRSEGLANVWLEAIASGTPVISPDVGGAREVIDRPEAGAIVPADPDAIAAAAMRIFADPPAQQAVRAAAERFTWEENSRQFVQHLRAAAETRPSRAA